MAYAGYQIATASGTITTQNLVPAGVATANSAVEITLNGTTTLIIQTTGTYTGALSLQGTVDGSAWVTLGGVPLLNINTGGYLATITSALQSIFKADASGFIKVRVTALAAVTGTATVSIRSVASAAMVALDTPLPTGANTIGAVTMTGTTITSITPGTGAANFGKAEDAIHGSGDIGMMVLGVLQTTPAALGGIGDYEPFTVGPDNRLMNDGAWAKAAGNAMLYFRSIAVTNVGTQVKASAGNIYAANLLNPHTAAVYLKFYNLATGVTVGASPVVQTIMIPPAVTGAYGSTLLTADQMAWLSADLFTVGISIAVTLLGTDADATVAPLLPIIQLQYK